MADIVEMTRRGSATEAKSTEAKSTGAKSAGVTSTVANEQRQRRERQLVGLLQAVERRILRDHREIAALRAKQAADARDLEQLRTLLQVMLTLAEQGAEREPGLSHDELERSIRRLLRLAASANRDR